VDIGEHLRAAYGIEVTATTQLDLGVHRIHRKGGGDWVARVYPATRGRRAVEDDARVLRLLERGDFPAERCATAEPVSVRGDEAVLVTTFVDGARARQDGSTFAWLGGLLGALNAKSADNLHAGGGWHHLTPSGTPADEQSAALDALAGMSSKGADVAAFDRLCEMVDDVDAGADLPHCLVHPDFVPANVITPPGGGAPVVIDWANAGRGPRLWSIGFLLWAAGVRSERLVDAVMTRYSRHCSLEDAEWDRLADVMSGRPLMLDVWRFVHGQATAAEALRAASHRRGLAARIADRARLAAKTN